MIGALSGHTALGRLIRLPLRALPKQARVPILSGPARGMTWIVGSSDHGCWLGTYEREKQTLIAAMSKPGSVVYDLGAHVGLFTLVSARAVGPTGTVIAFEPLPENVALLRRHVDVNALANVRVVPAAVSDRDGHVEFARGLTSTQGAIGAGGLIARSVSLDAFVAVEGCPAPDLIKIDVEGAEAAVLRGAREVIGRHRPVIVLATHSDALRAECVQLLEGWGYDVRAPWRVQHELVCVPRQATRAP